MSKIVTKAEFDNICAALWEELRYQNTLPRRTDDEAKDVPGFATLARVYLRKVEDDWANNPGVGKPAQVPEALDGLRKVAAILVRSMAYCGVRYRSDV